MALRSIRAAALAVVAVLGLALSACTNAPVVAQPDELSAEESQELLQAYLDSEWANVLARFPDAARPDVDIVRIIDSSEWATTVADCLSEDGFDATATVDGSISYFGVPSQGDSYAVAFYTCEARYPVDPKYNAPLNESQLNFLYDYFLNDLKPCLEGEGYEVPSAPSRQTFLESYAEDDGWSLYKNVAGRVGPGELAELNKKCPQLPEGLYG